MSLRANADLSMWQCRLCGRFWHGDPPEKGGQPCGECSVIPAVAQTESLALKKPAPSLVEEIAEEDKLTVSDFDVGPLIGSGGCSKVFLAWLKGSTETMALKVVDKKNLFEQEMQDQVAIEKQVLAREVPFCNRLFFSFQDVFALYLVMDYCPGGDLFDLMKVHGPFDEEQTSIYLAQVVWAVHHLHEAGFIHRDLKPENFLIDYDGNLKLGDFGYARPLSDPDDGQVIGSLHYIAPEIIDCNDYSILSDWWSVGVILFEMVVGEAPFPNEAEQEVLLGMFDFQRHFQLAIDHFQSSESGKASLTEQCVDLMLKLCHPNPKKRLGGDGADRIKSHPFFHEIDWTKISQVVPPFKPTLIDKLQFALSIHGGSAMTAQSTRSNLSHSANSVRVREARTPPMLARSASSVTPSIIIDLDEPSASVESDFQGELKRIRKVSVTAASKFGGARNARPRSQSYNRRPSPEQLNQSHNYMTLGKEEKFSATKMVSNEEAQKRHSATLQKAARPVQPAISSYEELKALVDKVKDLATKQNNSDILVFCDLVTKISYRLKASPFAQLSDLDKSIVQDMALTLETYAQKLCGAEVTTKVEPLENDIAPSPPVSRAEALKGLAKVPRSTSPGHFTVFGKREKPLPEVCESQTLPNFYHDYRKKKNIAPILI